jgi:hypothetical protein
MAITLNLRQDNPKLGALSGRTYEKKYTPVPNRVIKGELGAQIATVFKAITGDDIDPQDNTLTVGAEDGTLKKLFSPTVYGNEEGDGFYLGWGSRKLPLVISKKVLTFVDDQGKPTGAGPEFLEVNFYDLPVGNSRDLVIRCSYFEESTQETYVVDFRTWTHKNDKKGLETADDLNQFVKRTPNKVAPIFKPAPTGGGLDSETLSMSDLKPGVYTVIGYRATNAGGRVQFILHCLPNPELGQEAEFELWGHYCVNNCLEAGPTITPELPAEFRLNGFKDSKKINPKTNQPYKTPQGGLIPSPEGLSTEDIDTDF